MRARLKSPWNQIYRRLLGDLRGERLNSGPSVVPVVPLPGPIRAPRTITALEQELARAEERLADLEDVEERAGAAAEAAAQRGAWAQASVLERRYEECRRESRAAQCEVFRLDELLAARPTA